MVWMGIYRSLYGINDCRHLQFQLEEPESHFTLHLPSYPPSCWPRLFFISLTFRGHILSYPWVVNLLVDGRVDTPCPNNRGGKALFSSLSLVTSLVSSSQQSFLRASHFVGPRGIRHYVNTQLHVCLSLSNFSVNDTSSAVEQHLGNEWGAAMVWRPCHCQAPVYCPQKVVVDVEGSSLQEKANVAPVWWKARRVPHGESGESVLVEKKWTMRQFSPPFKGRIY